MAANSVTNQDPQYEFVGINRPLSNEFDLFRGTDFYLGSQNAQSLLDQLLAFGGERLTVDQVHQLLGTASDDRVAELAAAVLEHDPRRALELLGQAADHGLQLGELLDQLIAYWRDLMLLASAGAEAPGLNVSSKHRPILVEQAGKLTLDTVLAGLDILSATRARLRNRWPRPDARCSWRSRVR